MNKITDHPRKHAIEVFEKKSNNYLLVIPVLNENPRLFIQLKEIENRKYPIDIVISDGGSTDGTNNSQVLKALGVRATLELQDSGKLSAQLQIAFAFGIRENYSGIITMDGNGKDDPKGILEMIKALEDGYDFVQGSRFIAGGAAINTPPSRLLGIKLIHAPLTSLKAGFRYTDTTNGFRGHSPKLIENSKISLFRNVFSGYSLIAYIPIASVKAGLKAKEVPVIRSYPKEGPTPTKIHGLSGNINLLKILFEVLIGKYKVDD